MKIRYPIITLITLIIIEMIIAAIEPYPKWGDTSNGIIFLLILVCLGVIAYLSLRNIFRAVKGAVTGTPQGRDYQSEARRACEKVTPKKTEQNAFNLKN